MTRQEGVVVAIPRAQVEVPFPAWPAPARTAGAVMSYDLASSMATLLLVPVAIAIVAALAVAALFAAALLAPVLAVIVTVGAWRSAHAPEPEPEVTGATRERGRLARALADRAPPPSGPPRRTPPALRASPARSLR